MGGLMMDKSCTFIFVNIKRIVLKNIYVQLLGGTMGKRTKVLPDYFKPLTDTYLSLSNGQEFKNYKDLCLYLKQPIANGNTKVSQLEQFNLYFESERVGNKYVITEVYEYPLIDYSNSAYRSLIQKLVLDMLAVLYEDGKPSILLSTNQMLITLNMVNSNYRKYKNKHKLLGLKTKIELEYIRDFYNMTDGKLVKAIDNALNSLKSKCYIGWQKVMVIAYEYKIERADEWVRQIILNAQSHVLQQMNYREIYEVINNGKWNAFNKMVIAIVNEELEEREYKKIEYYYTAYDIVVGDKIIVECNKLDRYVLDNKAEIMKELNKEVVERNKEGYVKRYDKMLDGYEYKNNKVICNDDYIDSGNTLIDYTLKR